MTLEVSGRLSAYVLRISCTKRGSMILSVYKLETSIYMYPEWEESDFGT